MKGIIFDMDGVLVNSMPTHVLAWRSAFEKVAGITVKDRELYLMEGMRGMELIMKIFEHEGVMNDSLAKDVQEEKSRIFKSIRSSLPFDGVPEMIHTLVCAKAVVSGSTRSDVETIIEEDFGKEKFSAIITADDITRGKPDPSSFLAALNKMGLRPSDAVVLENAPLGVQAAANAGIDCFVVLNNTPLKRGDFGDTISGDRIFERTGSISEILRRMCE